MISHRDRRALRYGLAVLLGAWIGLRTLPAGWRTLQERQADFDERRTLLRETWAQLMNLDQFEDSVRVLRQAITAMAPRILSGGSAELALSDLTSRVTERAGRHHARVVTVLPVPDSGSAGQLRRLTTAVTIEGDFRGIVGVLRSLALDTLSIAVDRLQIDAPLPWAPESEPERLTAQVQLSAWYLTR